MCCVQYLATVVGVIWNVAAFIFGVGEEFKNVRALLIPLTNIANDAIHVINEPAWATFTSTTHNRLLVCLTIDDILLACTIAAVSNLIKTTELIQSLAFFMVSTATSALIGGLVFLCSFDVIGRGGLETWGCAIRWRDAYNASRWRRFWVERSYTFVKEQTILSLVFLIPLGVEGLLRITNQSHGSPCVDQGCRLTILGLGAPWFGFNLVRVYLIWITFCAWFRNVPTRERIDAPSGGGGADNNAGNNSGNNAGNNTGNNTGNNAGNNTGNNTGNNAGNNTGNNTSNNAGNNAPINAPPLVDAPERPAEEQHAKVNSVLAGLELDDLERGATDAILANWADPYRWAAPGQGRAVTGS